jgi:N-acyl-phosphatidylethanolamine-hydrolysing phospholipase D
MRKSYLLFTLALAMAGAAWGQATAAPPHHREGGFQNNHMAFEPKGVLTLMQWQWQSFRQGLPLPPQQPTPVVAPDLGFIHSNAKAGAAMQPALTWIGHATVLVQLGGINVLTDPIFSERASPVSFAGPRRAHAPGLTLAQLPRIDAVVVSHNHYDHFDEASVVALQQQSGGPPLFIVPLGNRAWTEGKGATRVVELDWWQSQKVGAVEIVFTPVQHWSGRSLTDRMRTLWGGYAMFAPDFHVFHAGDTGYSQDFRDIRERFAARQGEQGFDVALLPVGAYEPRWFMASQHINPVEAVQVHRDLRAKRSMGMHWGTFALTDESLDEPPRALAQARREAALPDDEFFVMAIGQTRKLPPRLASAAVVKSAPP